MAPFVHALAMYLNARMWDTWRGLGGSNVSKHYHFHFRQYRGPRPPPVLVCPSPRPTQATLPLLRINRFHHPQHLNLAQNLGPMKLRIRRSWFQRRVQGMMLKCQRYVLVSILNFMESILSSRVQ